MKQFRKAFVANPNVRYDPAPLRAMVDDIVYVCDIPVFDDYSGEGQEHRYEIPIKQKLKDFDPKQDIMVFYGDGLIFGMMVFYAATEFASFKIARFSSKKNTYIIRDLKEEVMA